MNRLSLFEDDPYRRLRPPDGGSYRDLCACAGSPPIMLMCMPGSYNPLRCLHCNSEVAPETIGFPAPLAAEIAEWREYYDALDVLRRRGSPGHQNWAFQRLKGAGGRLHRLGLAVRARLENYRPTYYWIFAHTGSSLFPVTRCPSCSNLLQFYFEGQVGWWRCDACGIVADGTDEDPPLLRGDG